MRRPERLASANLVHGSSTDRTGTSSNPIEFTCAGFLCRLQIWEDSRWESLPAHERPIEVEFIDGLGWVGAVPVRCLN